MNVDKPDNLPCEWIETRHAASWEICMRLKELGVSCEREPYQPLKIQPHSPLAVAQAWSVFRQFTHPRSELASWLDHCWSYPASQACLPLER
ncbi:MAG: hypothetical protein VKL39_02005 [Leptolyngbyaceae bacterium]|nr:hypothetical protein [Leptolyngbyaceae bacterium]